MMIRLTTALTGVLSAGIVAAVEVASAASTPTVVGWSFLGGVAGAGVAWGAMSTQVKNAHTRITAEKTDREKSVAELKADMIRGFGEIRTDLREQTRTVLEAIDRGPR